MAAPKRTPRSWPFRLGAWVMVLGLAIAGMVAIVSRGSASETVHTYSDTPIATPAGTPARQLHKVATYQGDATVVGGAVVIETDKGARGLDARSGKQVWSYERSDLLVCARGYSETRVFLVYGDGDQCDEAIALEARTGKRGWQRTIESGGANTITFGPNSMISVGPQKLIAYEQVSGFERFTLAPNEEPTDKRTDAAASSGGCVFVSASAGRIVNVLQKCRTLADAPWTFTLLAEDAYDGKARETGRTALGLADPQLIASFTNGAALLADGTTLYIAGGGRANPEQLVGITASDAQSVALLPSFSFDLITSRSVVYRLRPGTASPAWQVVSGYRPSLLSNRLTTLAGGVLRIYSAETGTVVTQSTLVDPMPTKPTATVSTIGGSVAISDDEATTIYG